MHLFPEPGNQGSVIRELIPFLKALKHPLAHYPHPKWLSQHTPQSSLRASFSGFVCFFQARFAFQPFNEGSAAREECRCMLSSFQPKDNPRYLGLLVPGTGLVGDLCPLGTPQGISQAAEDCLDKVNEALWSSSWNWNQGELAVYYGMEMENGANSGLETSHQ